MLRLLLLRHAKAQPAEPGIADRDRPLSSRGVAAAKAMGRFMRQAGLRPDLVLCSPARRARDTWALVTAELDARPRVLIEEAIYDFGADDRLLEAIRRQADASRAVLIVGHNPALEGLALRLAVGGDAALRARMARKYPTAALAVIDFEAESWRAIDSGRLTGFTRPQDLPA